MRILLGVSGGIAAYKAAELVRRLRERGAEVRVVMTASAERFVTPLTFQALSGNPVRASLWDEQAEAAMGHIELARWAQHVLVAPASADFIARLAHGLADDLLATLCLATEAPIALAPAMNRIMWAHPATQANIALLRTRGVAVHGPGAGDQACGETGAGRMLEPHELAARMLGGGASHDDAVASPSHDAAGSADRAPKKVSGALAGRRVLVTAGPTFEDIDPVRFIGNRSSGRMGFAVAAAAAAAGADVQLVAGPCPLPTPAGVARTDVRSAADMHAAVMASVPGHHVFIGAAAVADYRPLQQAGAKIRKQQADMSLALTRTRDILAEVAAMAPRPFVVGFAAETEQLQQRAGDKLARKRLDLIAANLVGQPGTGFDAEDNALLVLWHGGQRELPRAPKQQLAAQLVALIAERLADAEDH